MKIWHGLLVGLVLLASCSDSSDNSDSSEGNDAATSTTATSGAVEQTTTVAPTSSTLLPSVDEDALAAAPIVDGTSSSTCDFFSPAEAGNWFSTTNCDRWPNVDIQAVTLWCPADDCDSEFEVVIDLAGEFGLSSINLFEGVEITVTGSDGTISCIARQNYSRPEFGCLDDSDRYTIPPEDVWLNSEDGLRHRFGPGASFIGAIEAVSVSVTILGADNAGPVGIFTVLDPELPGRYEPARTHDPVITRRLASVLLTELALADSDEFDCVVDAVLDGADLASLSAEAGHGAANLGDNSVSAVGQALEQCDPIRQQYEIALTDASTLPESCDVDSVIEAFASEFSWTRVVTDVRTVARAEIGPIEQSTIFEDFRAKTYEEFDCLTDQ